MEFITMRPATKNDLAGIQQLLTAAELPLDDIENHLKMALVAEQNGRIVSTAALELYGTAALLRSVAVDADLRRTGLGRQMIELIIDQAQQRGITEIYLLTETAVDYFPRFGFQPVTREEVPSEVQQSVEFTSACPASAQAMRLNALVV